MKKINKSINQPALLAAYYAANPLDTWSNFTNTDQAGKCETQDALRRDQYHLCAYCEIDLLRGDGMGNDDFRVEHFHPKSRPPQPPPNWDLDWGNLLGTCHGGSVSTVSEASRCTNPDYSCDIPKGNQVLGGLILNPITDIPAFPPLFAFQEDGQMRVSENCPPNLKTQAERTITELRLSGDSSQNILAARLSKLRAAVIENLRDTIKVSIQQGKTLEFAMEELAEIMFPSAPQDSWPAFFSTIRWYLGPVAEDRLKEINYSG